MFKKRVFLLLILVVSLLPAPVNSADKEENSQADAPAKADDPYRLDSTNTFNLVNEKSKHRRFAKAYIRDVSDPEKVFGEIVFMEAGEKGLFIQGIFRETGIPQGFHGVHIHEIGNCENSGLSAGNHFNPLGSKHGFLPRDGFQGAHLGDMGNINFNVVGTGFLGVILPGVHLSGNEANVLGLSVVLDEGRDDFSESADSGKPIGCGIIEALK